MKKFSKGLAIVAVSAMLSLSTLQSANAAPGALSTAPLFLSNIVEPNVFFTLDDSGSMGWMTITDPTIDGFNFFGGSVAIGGCRIGWWFWDPNGFTCQIPTVASNQNTWILRTHHANKLYYNPNKIYEPWAGTNADGTPMFTDANPAAVQRDPYYNKGTTTNLATWKNGGTRYLPVYYKWVDRNLNGIVDQPDYDPSDRVEIAAGSAEMDNFANWYQYYRSRMLTMKAAIGRVIQNSDATRMGLALFNKTSIQKYSETMSDANLKRDLLKKFYDTRLDVWTPTRRALQRTANYFESTNINAPILPASQGGECQQNFNIMLTDGFENRSYNNGNVGNTDRDGTGPFDGGLYADTYSNTLADIAMEYYEDDLRPDLADKVPTDPGIDEAEHQHLVNYAVSFGLRGSLVPGVDGPEDPGFTGWPQPVSDTPSTIDDLWHAAYNSRGLYLNAEQPDELQSSLDTAIADIAQRTATAAAVSINSAKLTTESVVYLAQFNTNRWQGNLFAFKITDLDTGELSVTPEWGAADVLNARDITSNPRTILTHNGVKGVPFQWAGLSVAQRNDLKTNPAGGTDADAVGYARMTYIRGDRSNEGGSGYGFRERLSLLADLVNSGPVYVGKPALSWPDKAPFPSAPGLRYSDFKAGPAASRPGIVYAGSNGAMMHGFAEANGEEVLSYIANNLFSTAGKDGLHYLTDPDYQHKYYNDLTPTVSDIYADIGGGLKWQTILISGQRGGGRGIFALNVNDPASFSEANASNIVMWEFSDADDIDLGYTYSRPQIALANNGRWVAIFGNGYNDNGDGEAKLFIVDIAAGADGSWDSGDYIEITTGSGSTTDRNGLATPSLADIDGNGTVDRVYGGDLKGQMWIFDLSSSVSTSWDIPGNTPLFTTQGNRPITSKPALSKHPKVSDDGTNEPNVLVLFGTGQYLVNGDKASTDQEHFYGVWDKGDSNLTELKLVEQVFDPGFVDINGDSARVLSNKTINWSGGDYGWFFKLPDSGERSVTSAVVRGGNVFFNTFVPVSDACSVGGFGFRMVVGLADGGSPEANSIDVNGDFVIDDSDKATDGSGNTSTIVGVRQEGFLPEPVFIENISYTAEKPAPAPPLFPPPTGRFSWQELLQ